MTHGLRPRQPAGSQRWAQMVARWLPGGRLKLNGVCFGTSGKADVYTSGPLEEARDPTTQSVCVAESGNCQGLEVHACIPVPAAPLDPSPAGILELMPQASATVHKRIMTAACIQTAPRQLLRVHSHLAA